MSAESRFKSAPSKKDITEGHCWVMSLDILQRAIQIIQELWWWTKIPGGSHCQIWPTHQHISLSLLDILVKERGKYEFMQQLVSFLFNFIYREKYNTVLRLTSFLWDSRSNVKLRNICFCAERKTPRAKTRTSNWTQSIYCARSGIGTPDRRTIPSIPAQNLPIL